MFPAHVLRTVFKNMFIQCEKLRHLQYEFLHYSHWNKHYIVEEVVVLNIKKNVFFPGC